MKISGEGNRLSWELSNRGKQVKSQEELVRREMVL